jgi:hypothetical protein
MQKKSGLAKRAHSKDGSPKFGHQLTWRVLKGKGNVLGAEIGQMRLKTASGDKRRNGFFIGGII